MSEGRLVVDNTTKQPDVEWTRVGFLEHALARERAETQRLRGLVYYAYMEGWQAAFAGGISVIEPWRASKTRKALE